jgi:hypothetical protein
MNRQAKMQTQIVGSIESFKLITDGSFCVNVNNVMFYIDSLDFSSCITYDDVANVIQDRCAALSGAITGLEVHASSPTGDDVTFLFTSGMDGMGMMSNVSTLWPSSTGTDISGEDYLNGQQGNAFIMNMVYFATEADIASIKTNNNTLPGMVNILNVYDLLSDQVYPNCFEKCVIEMPQYSQWYNDLNAIEPFTSRTVYTFKIDNNQLEK